MGVQQKVGEFLAPLRRCPSWQVSLEQFQIGIDNRHIDVAISHQFRSSLLSLVEKIVHEDLAKHGWANTGQFSSGADIDRFKENYRSVLQGALEQIHANTAVKELLQLLHLVLLKLMLDAPQAALSKLRAQLQHDVESTADLHSGRAMEMHDRIVGLAQLEPGIRYRTLNRLFKIVQRLESKELRKMRKSVVGSSWVVSKLILFNPLLHLPDMTSEEFLLNHYPLLCVDREGGNHFDLANRYVTTTYSDYLPDWAKPQAVQTSSPKAGETTQFQITQRERHSGFSEFLEGQRILERNLSTKEFKEIYVSWLDDPKNLEMMLKQTGETKGGWFSRAPVKQKKPLWDNPEHNKIQQQLKSSLLKQFDRSGLTRRAIAAYRTERLYRQFNGQISHREIYHYLIDALPKRALLKKFSSTPDKGAAIIKALDVVHGYIRRMPANKQQGYTIRYLKDFLTFRRDLKLAYYTYQQMSRLNILQDADSIQLSRDNGSLYEFRLSQDGGDAQEGKIKAHAILKADVRGSTEITSQLVEKRLNPATHFSMNFFGPITKLLNRFGAKKVFVEGDALILSVLETGAISTQGMTVANACGLARRILLVMEAQNSQNKAHNLPKLELGLGIAFSSEAPAYLHDEQRKIMISPAINEADRLSSCSSELRYDTSWRKSQRHRVEVFSDDGGTENKGARRLRYNVNGIELAPPAFKKLKSEMVLHKMKVHSRSGEGDTYHVGRFVDRRGSAHWLVIREAVIKTWQREDGMPSVAQADAHFYEVVTDPELISKVKSRLNAKKAPNPMASQAEEDVIPFSLESDA